MVLLSINLMRVGRNKGGLALVGLLALLVPACSSGPSLTEYGAQVESLVAEMNGTLDRLDADVEAAPSLEATKRYARDRVAARDEFVEAMRALDSPQDATELHEAAVGIMGRLAQAEAALAEVVYSLESNVGIDEIWLTPEGVAARSADQAAIELCLAAQSEFDRTEMRAELGDVPWIPPEMKEVVIVAFNCLVDDR